MYTGNNIVTSHYLFKYNSLFEMYIHKYHFHFFHDSFTQKLLFIYFLRPHRLPVQPPPPPRVSNCLFTRELGTSASYEKFNFNCLLNKNLGHQIPWNWGLQPAPLHLGHQVPWQWGLQPAPLHSSSCVHNVCQCNHHHHHAYQTVSLHGN